VSIILRRQDSCLMVVDNCIFSCHSSICCVSQSQLWLWLLPGDGQFGSCCCFHRDRISFDSCRLWNWWPPEVLAGTLAWLPLLDEHLHSSSPHRPTHPIQGGRKLECCKGTAGGNRPLRLSQMVSFNNMNGYLLAQSCRLASNPSRYVNCPD
jgi:hypothetical protein